MYNARAYILYIHHTSPVYDNRSTNYYYYYYYRCVSHRFFVQRYLCLIQNDARTLQMSGFYIIIVLCVKAQRCRAPISFKKCMGK